MAQDPIACVYWLSLAALAHTWVLYAVLLGVLSRLKPPPPDFPAPEPDLTVSFIIAAHNEEQWIGERLKNLEELQYNHARMEVLVASDGSTDGTCCVVREVQGAWAGVRLLEFPRQRGRAVLHNEAVSHATGDILVFTDAETRFDPLFLEYVLPHFRTPRVAAVSGRIHYVNEGVSAITRSAGLYWNIEERIRAWESRLGLLAFGTGAAFCMRRELYAPQTRSYDDVDYAETLSLVGRGYHIRYEPRGLAFDTIAAQAGTTHRVRVRRTSMAFRSILRGICAHRLWKRPAILFSVVSHKVLRHLSPLFLMSVLLSNVLLWSSGEWYRATLVMQGIFYALALAGGLALKRGWRLMPLAIPFTFVLLNFSRMLGVLDGMFRKPPPTYR
jgi:poly-beta-1,6-N-acetyl-D-glucosamine synthase